MSRKESLREEGRVLIQNGLKAFDMAEVQFDAYNNDETDAASKNWCCYMLQQSLELMLKGLIKYFYGSFTQSHSLDRNRDTVLELSEKYIELREVAPVIEDIDRSMIVTTYKWSNLARYKDLWVNKNEVKHVEEVTYRLYIAVRKFNTD